MKQSTKQCSIDGESFSNLIRKLSKKYYIPFSLAHLTDLSSSKQNASNEQIHEDLEYIRAISNNYAITMKGINNYELDIINTVDVFEEFKGVLTSSTEIVNPQITIIGDKHEINMEKLKKDHPLKNLLEQNNGILSPELMLDFIKLIAKERNNPEFYKKYRKQVSELKSQFRKTPDSIINQRSDYFKGIIPFLDFVTEEDEGKINSSFLGALESFLSINGENINNLDKSQKILASYMVLDFNPRFYDKVTGSNRPSNIYNDISHLFFASEAKYYITEDKSTFKKSSLVAKLFFPKLKILKMNDFQHRFC